MKKEFTPYGRALKLKELGFDESCFGFYYDDGELKIKEGNISRLGYINAPTFSQAFRWFREKYDLHGSVRKRNKNGVIYFEQIFDEDVLQNGPFSIYEEAELACLDKLIEIVESKQNK
jgi:Zn-finger nucleic acid-binding protein